MRLRRPNWGAVERAAEAGKLRVLGERHARRVDEREDYWGEAWLGMSPEAREALRLRKDWWDIDTRKRWR